MSQVQTTITNLPQAGPIQGTEAVPIVQNGVTKQTTTAAIAAAPSQFQTFLTLNQESTLPNSRYLSTGTGLGLVDGGAQSYYRITLNGASGSLESVGNGFVVKDSGNSVISRTIQVSGNGLAITNGNGVAGNPVIALDGLSASLAGMSGSGLVAVLNGTTVTPRSILGVTDQTLVTNGNAFAGNPIIGLADNAILPGTGSMTIPKGTSAQQPAGSDGQFRFNDDTQTFDGYSAGSWRQFSLAGGLTSFSAGGTGFTPNTPTSGAITLGGVLNVGSGGTGATTLTGYVKGSGTSAMTASATVPTTDLSGTVTNAQLANSAITINGSSVSLGGSVTVTATASNALTISTGLTGASYNGSTPVTIAIDSTVATLTGVQTLTNKSISGSSNTLTNIGNSSLTNSSVSYNGVSVALGSSGTITAVNPYALTIGTGLTGTSYDGSGNVTVAIDSTVATLTGTQTLSNKTLSSPEITGAVKLTATGAGAYTPFAQSFSSSVSNFNGYQLNYIQNTNNGSDASVDYVAYNDASDVDSYFIDMGISSSNYTSPTYTVFPPNGAYVYTGGGLSGQASALLLGTSNTASDIVFFTGGTLTANTRATIKGTGNFLIGTTTDNGELLQVNGTVNIAGATSIGGAATFGSTVTLNANPTLALQAATKEYVDNQVTAGIHIHEPVRVETTGNLTATYVQGGTTFNITAITGGNTVTTSVNHGLAVNDQIWLYTSAGNGLSTNTAYFVYSTPALNQLTLSLTFGGSQVTGLTNASGLTYATRANSGIGATLTNAGTQVALTVDTIALSVNDRVMVRLQTNGAENGVYTVTAVGSGSTNWVLTRATDANFVSPSDPQGLGTGDYFFTREGALNAGDSHVLTTEPNTMIIGYTTLTYTQFSGAVDYVGGTNIDITGQVISLTGTVAATNGGTGTNTVTTGDLLYGSATNTWSKLPLGIAYKSLIINASGTQVEWNAIPLNQTTAVSGQLGASNGGTGQSSYAIGDIIYASASTTLSKLALGTQGQVLTAGASGPTWSGIAGGTF